MLDGIEILQICDGEVAPVGRRAIGFAGQMARQLGARVYLGAGFAASDDFLGRGKMPLPDGGSDPLAWVRGAANRYLLVVSGPDMADEAAPDRAVVLRLAPRASEATLFAESGLADLLGDPAQAPLIPAGAYGAGTLGYGVFAALSALITKVLRTGQDDSACLDGAGVLAWVNWKAASLGDLGNDIEREGEGAEWPVLPCRDGYVALVYQARDWPRLVAMVGDERLADERFATPRARLRHRDEYLAIVRAWTARKRKHELAELFLEYEIPAAPVMAAADLLTDPLLLHRDAFSDVQRPSGAPARSPRLPHRVTAGNRESRRQPGAIAEPALPLAGVITAGAGVSALLADLGAEVLKIESHSYPDPFRQWGGEAVSPLFKCNNRNKYGVAVDLKTTEGRAAFEGLVREADVVVENFRRGVLDRLGFSFDRLAAINPELILASVSGQGLSGPGCGASSFGSTLEASSGFAANVCYEGGQPYITGRNVNYPDQTVVLYAAAVIALAVAGSDGGMHLDVSQRDVAVFLAGEDIERVAAGEPGAPADNGRAYRAADGSWVAFDDRERRAVWAAWVAQRTGSEAVKDLAAAGIGAAVVRRGSQMYAELAATPIFATSPDSALVKGFPFQLRRAPMTIRLNSPDVGEHTSRFLSA